MFECPKCKTGVPKWTAATLKRNDRIQCTNCGSTLTPIGHTMPQITGITAGAIGGAAFFTMKYAGLPGVLVWLVLGFTYYWYLTVIKTEFQIEEDSLSSGHSDYFHIKTTISENIYAYQPGDSVVWCKKRFADNFYWGVKAIVLETTEKRVKIKFVENNRPQIRYIKPQNLVSESSVKWNTQN